MDDNFVFTLTTNANILNAGYQEYEVSGREAVIAEQGANLTALETFRQASISMRMMDRALMTGMSSAGMIGLAFPGMHGALGAIQKSAYAVSMLYGAYNIYKGVVNAKIAAKQMEAAAATLAAAAAQDWWAIALAGGVAVAVYAAFNAPQAVNLNFNIDWTSGRGRRQVAGEIGKVR